MYVVRLADGREFGPATIELIEGWAREGRIPKDAVLVPTDGSAPQAAFEHPALRVILNAPPTFSAGIQETDAPLSGLIPYKNPPALVGYYISIASLIPFVGMLAGPIAIKLGIVGMRKRLKDPKLRGLAHAWVAIILGSIGTLGNLTCITSMIISAAR